MPPAVRKRVLQLVIIAVGAWLAVVVALFLLQRKMVFAAPPAWDVHSTAGVQHVTIGAGDTEVHALWAEPAEGGPVVVHFHGNAEQLAGQAQMAGLYGRRGLGFLAVEYPGYGPMSAQEPSEDALIDAGAKAVAWLNERGVPKERIVLQGRSLGSGVATALAGRGLGSRLVLLSPFRSLVAVASGHYPWVPVSMLMRDRFDNERGGRELKIPVLIVHGDVDRIVPYSHGKALSEVVAGAELVTVNGAGHNDLLALGGTKVLGKMMSFALQSAATPDAPTD